MCAQPILNTSPPDPLGWQLGSCSTPKQEASPISTELQTWPPGTSAGDVIWIAGVPEPPKQPAPHIKLALHSLQLVLYMLQLLGQLITCRLARAGYKCDAGDGHPHAVTHSPAPAKPFLWRSISAGSTCTPAVLGLGEPCSPPQLVRAGPRFDVHACFRSLALLLCSPTNTPSLAPMGPLPGCVHCSSSAWQRSHCSLVSKQLPAPVGHKDPFGRLQPHSKEP